MYRHFRLISTLISFFFLFLALSSCNVCFAESGQNSGKSSAGENPFTAKAFVIRYWRKQVSNNLPKPSFLVSKASPLNAVDSALLTKLADQNALSSHFSSFCSSANMFCFPDISPSLEKHDKDANFASYSNINFTNYGTSRAGGMDSFKNYSDNFGGPIDSFRRYSRDSAGHDDKFANYAPNNNVIEQDFNTYGVSATGGTGEFKNYMNEGVNVPNLRFSTYESDANGREQSFSSYTDEANAGDESFSSYGNNGNGLPLEFKSYGKDSNVMGSSFKAYGEEGNGANDSFTSYGVNGNVPENKFVSYGDGGNAGVDSFSTYRDQSNVGDDSFQSYAKNSNSAKVNFANYGKSFNEGSDTFKGYGKGAVGQAIGFKTYGVNNTFKDYDNKKAISFAAYTNPSSAKATSSLVGSKKPTNKWLAEPGKFFRESMLKEGIVMPMPDIRDKMPPRSFLPRSITSKLPFSSSRISELKQIFHAAENSTMERVLQNTLEECERAPSRGETKKCVGSLEGMIDFAVSVLGHNVVVRSTENVNGSTKNVMIGAVKGINGGRVTKSVSCHQSLFPYLVYYCHSVPKVRVYEADILDANSKAKINNGVAICHIDTSAWSPGHGAFISLGSSPGKIEVCHWIFENDMTWTVAD
ncbi:PREDICTED: polygalacturonase 1 beta-like protein 3 [Nelumbo nucifera]|uniref:Polygalacturonase 1 beta-like protein 3 n=1 Tax=Nelumbo nucifera TaxID=4432 RepID=A0A1U7ZIE3_NELNU|nr:PREDICTED: polygalacturonase 1 beta-like protein 3 [Nelumbo nucifera]